MNKRKIITFIWSSIIFASLASGLLASVAWFASANKFDVDITGSVVEEYFHCGNGTLGPDDPNTEVIEGPFVITRPIHYYHLVEFFQRETALDTTAEFGTDYLYFQVGYDLDNDGDLEVYDYDDQGIYQGSLESPSYSETLNMAYYSGDNALMPIGTNEVPFIGVFDGKADEGIVISNLNIHCAETVLVGNNTVNRAASDIGIFGYVADSDGSSPTSIQNLKVNNLTIDLTDVTSTVASPTTSIAHTDAHAGVAYVGYIAGHVHSYTNYSSTGPTNAAPLYNVYVTNAKIEGGAGATCGFGYIGLVDTVDGEEPTAVESQVSTTHGSGGGQGDDWGGSINMLELNKRIYHFLNKNLEKKTLTNVEYNAAKITSSRYHRYFADNVNDKKTFAISVYEAGQGTSSNSWYNANPTNPPSNRYPLVYRLEGKNDSAKDGTSGTGSIKIPGTYIPLLTDTAENGYTVLKGNTGYIASAGNYSATTVRTASYKNNFVGNSMSPFSTADNTSFNVDKLEVLSNSAVDYAANNYARINNGIASEGASIQTNYAASIDPNSLSGYSKAYSSIKEVLAESNYVQGLHFTGNEINKNNTVSIPNAYINGSEKTDYSVLTSSVDFNAKEKGSIKFFAGSYYNSVGTNADSFFSLHVIERNGNAISNEYQIFDIYQNTNTNTNKQYPNLYYDQNGNLIEIGYTSATVTKGKKLFDLRFLHNAPPVANAVYYFEIPVNAGEFALGSVSSSKTKGAYLMYLDIGTSGSEEEQTHNQTISVADAAIFTQIDFQIDSFVTNSCFNIAFVIPEGATKETFSVTVSSGDVVYEGEDYFCYEIVIVNTTQHDFVISALLMDDDDNPNNDYFYMYTIKYNTGARTEYTSSNTYTGVSGGTSMTPTHT